MRRYVQFTVTEPLEPASTPLEERVQIELAIIGIDLHTGHVTLPGGFVCTLQRLAGIVNTAVIATEHWERWMGSSWRLP